jgi:hypothetical protein
MFTVRQWVLNKRIETGTLKNGCLYYNKGSLRFGLYPQYKGWGLIVVNSKKERPKSKKIKLVFKR